MIVIESDFAKLLPMLNVLKHLQKGQAQSQALDEQMVERFNSFYDSQRYERLPIDLIPELKAEQLNSEKQEKSEVAASIGNQDVPNQALWLLRIAADLIAAVLQQDDRELGREQAQSQEDVISRLAEVISQGTLNLKTDPFHGELFATASVCAANSGHPAVLALSEWYYAYKQAFDIEKLFLFATDDLLPYESLDDVQTGLQTNNIESRKDSIDSFLEDYFIFEDNPNEDVGSQNQVHQSFETFNPYPEQNDTPVLTFIPPVLNDYQSIAVSQEQSRHSISVVLLHEAKSHVFDAQLLQPIAVYFDERRIEFRLQLSPEGEARQLLRTVEDEDWQLNIHTASGEEANLAIEETESRQARPNQDDSEKMQEHSLYLNSIPANDIHYKESFAGQLLLAFRPPASWLPSLVQLDREALWRAISSFVITVQEESLAA